MTGRLALLIGCWGLPTRASSSDTCGMQKHLRVTQPIIDRFIGRHGTISPGGLNFGAMQGCLSQHASVESVVYYGSYLRVVLVRLGR